jgi:acyl dehydratase
MPLSSRIVGKSGEPLSHEIDARWTMAYAAALGDTQPEYLDTTARADVLAHPLFPVCFEWPAFLSSRHLPHGGMEPAEAVRGVHAGHDLILHRPLRAGTTVTTVATVVGVEARRPGAYQVTRLDSVDSAGAPVCTTWYGNLMRGVAVANGDRWLGENAPPQPAAVEECKREFEIPIAAGAAHTYTECARIWNPIHTDASVASAAGLPGIILHGTATLARAMSRVVTESLDGRVADVARIAGRFSAMVAMPSRIVVRIVAAGERVARFEVRNAAGKVAIRDGLVALRD